MADHHVLLRRLNLAPPALQTKAQTNPTLLVSWFCTIFSLVVILIRIAGRWVRTEMLFREDKVMFWSILPLLARMGFVHVILIWGTNNTVTTGLTDLEIQHRMIGSKLVLPSRILYAAYIWVAKVTVVEFLQRTIGQSWIKWYERGVKMIYGYLALTFVGVVISTLAECQPFTHYWQVVPDPGAACRSGVTQLITMGVCDITSDIVLIVFPIPIVIMSKMPVRKKISLIFLFLLSLVLVAITAFRVPSTIERHESQQYRSLLASLEILAATFVANAVVIGSFVRDRGVKKAKFRADSVDESVLSRQQTRTKSIAMNHWGSDEDLVRDLGISVRPTLRHATNAGGTPRPAPIATPIHAPSRGSDAVRRSNVDTTWTFGNNRRSSRRRSSVSSNSSTSTDIKLRELDRLLEEPVSPGTERVDQKMNFFDVGGLVDQPITHTSPEPPKRSRESISGPQTGPNIFLSDVGGLLDLGPEQDDEIRIIPASPQEIDQTRGSRRTEEFREFLRTASPFRSGEERNSPRVPRKTSRSPMRQPLPYDAGPDDLDFGDAGGLLK